MEQPITLSQMLEARERRAWKQQELLCRYRLPLVCFTMNIAGPIKNSPLILGGYGIGRRLLEEQLSCAGLPVRCFEQWTQPTGNEAFYVIDGEPAAIKGITVLLEEASPLGRLFDLDVIDPSGIKIERDTPRRCLICGNPAKQCARSRTHTVEQLQEQTNRILRTAIEDDHAQRIANLAVRALLYEVCTTPKPGLVDRENSGSHKDMDIFTFMTSACALWPYFERCCRIGMETAERPARETFLGLRQAGRLAEGTMFAATKGINTHKGAIFSMGIVCGALGRLSDGAATEEVLQACAEMTVDIVSADFARLTPETAKTMGQRLYLQYGIEGVRGQVARGLPAVQEAGLPTLKQGIRQGLSLNDAGCAALLALLCADTDTNVIARSDLQTYEALRSRVGALRKQTPYPSRELLEQLNREFVERNISPGGSADLLAICYLLYFLEEQSQS